MNQEQRIQKLQTLLTRVQTRANQARAYQPPKAQPNPPATTTGPFALAADVKLHISPVSVPSADNFDTEETRPFSKISIQQPMVASEPELSLTPDVEISVEETRFSPDDVGLGGLEIVGDAEDIFGEEAASAEHRIMELDLEGVSGDAPRVTPPPESGPQELSTKTELEVDDGPVVPKSLEKPSMEMLGHTVDLPQGKEELRAIEIDQSPVPPPIKEIPTIEMEAVIPGSQAPGVFPPTDSEKVHIAFLEEPATKDWELPDSSGIQPTKTSDLMVEDEPFEAPSNQVQQLVQPDEPFDKAPEIIEVVAQDPVSADVSPASPTASTLSLETEVVAQGPVSAEVSPASPTASPTLSLESEVVAPAEATMESEHEPEPLTTRFQPENVPQVTEQVQPKIEPQPIVVEVAGKPVAIPALAATQVATLQGSLRSDAPLTFLEALDRSLSLGKKS